MTSLRLRPAIVCLFLAVLAAPHADAQTRRAQNRPTVPPVEAPEQVPVEPETTRYRIHRPVFRVMQDYTVRADDIIRELQVVFGNVTIEGRVEGDVLVVMGSARMTGTGVVEGTLAVVGGSANIDAGARVGHELVVVGGTLTAPPTFSADGNQVIVGTPFFGEVMEDILPWVTQGLLWGRPVVPTLAWVWAVVLVAFLVYLALNTVFDRAIGATADVIADRPLSAFVGGMLVLLLSVPALAIIAASVIGLAVVPFLLCGLFIAGLFGKTAVARAIGRSAIRAESPEGRFAGFVAFVIGSALLVLAYMVPLLGFVTWALASVIGLGAATATFRAHLRRERKTVVPAEAAVVPEPVPVPAGEAASLSSSFAPPIDPAIPPVPAYVPPVEPPPPVFDQGLAHYPRATFLDRLAAFVLDCILVGIANAVLFDSHRNDDLFFFLLLGYHIAFWAWKGTTLGGIICNLRITRTDGTDPRFVDALVRGLASIFSIAALGIGCFWMLQDRERQMWHDKIAGTLVVKVPRHVVLP